MLKALKHVRPDANFNNENEFSFGPDDLDTNTQIPKDLAWNTVQAWVNGNSKLFSKIANPFKKFLPAGTDAEDLKSMAFIAAFEAIEKASAHDRLDDFVPFFCRIYKTEIMKQAKGVPVVTMVEIPLHETEGIYHDSAIKNIRFEEEVDPNVTVDVVIDQSLTLLTTSQQQFTKIIISNPCLSVAELAKQLGIHVSGVHSRVKCIVERIPLKKMNHKSTRIKRHFVIKPVSDQKSVASDSPSISIDTNNTESTILNKYFSNIEVSEQQNVRPQLSAVRFGSTASSSCKKDCSIVGKNARKGDTFLASIHDYSFGFEAGLLVDGNLIRTPKNNLSHVQTAPSEQSATTRSTERSSPAKGAPLGSLIDDTYCRGSGRNYGVPVTRNLSGSSPKPPDNLARDICVSLARFQ